MKQDKKILSLIKAGLTSSTLSEMTSSQIDSLYSRLLEEKLENNEQTKVVTDVYKASDKNQLAAVNQMLKNPDQLKGKNIQVQAETEISEDDNQGLEDLAVAMQSKEVSETFESKKQQKYFFAKCGDGKTKEQKKWCKMAKEFAKSTKDFDKLPEKKYETKEEFSFSNYLDKVGSVITGKLAQKAPNSFRATFESKLEENITNMIQKHTSPKMSKKDFIKTIVEAEKEIETPVKPDVKPEKPRPATPYQPKHKPAPKAKEKEVETPVKPDVKPEKPRPATPYQPKHKPAPKAKDLPNWLNFDSIGLDLK